LTPPKTLNSRGAKTIPGLFQINLSFVVALATYHYNEARKQRGLEKITQPYLCYIDDVLLISETATEHKRAVFFLLFQFSRFHLTVNRSKCELGTDSTTFLGHYLTNKTLQRAHKYVDTFKRLPVPKTIRDLRRYLGISNFVRNYLPRLRTFRTPSTR